LARNDNKKQRDRSFWSLAAEFAEPVVAFVAGGVLAILGFTGDLDEKQLISAALVVLSLLAFSLLRERLLRTDTRETVEALDGRLDDATDSINALQSGNPYRVICHETTWDIIEPDGSLVIATRRKEIRIDQNNVFALHDFAWGDGSRENEYSPGEAVAEFHGEGRTHQLIALGRIYYRGEDLDFNVKRTVRDGFLGDHEFVSIDTRDATEKLRVKILWPPDRPPTALRLVRSTPSMEFRNTDVFDQVAQKDGRPTYEGEFHDPEQGGSTTIEWEWDPIEMPPEAKPADISN